MRSVNSKGLDIRLRLPAGFEALEAPARSAVQARLGRGSVNAQLSFSRQASAGQSSINLEAMESLVEALLLVRQGCEARGIPVAPVTGEALALSPTLQQSVRDDLPELVAAAMPAMTEGLGQALDALVDARQAEGRHIHSTISGQVDRIESLIRDASSAATDSVRVLRERLSRQVAALVADQSGLSDGRLEQEVALLATKADVQEELDRLLAHCAAARDLLSLAEPMGRRLEFLTQEFNREANTLCSKAATDAMTRIGLDLKTVIDQLREQAANVE